MLSPQLQALARAGGFDLKDVLAGTLMEIETAHDTFWVFVVDPAEGKVVVESTHPQLRQPTVFFHQGATSGGSAVKLGWIGVGYHLRMNVGTGGVLTTSEVKHIRSVSNDERTQRMHETAEKFDQRPIISNDEFAARVRELITGEFPIDQQERISTFVGEFNHDGQGIMLGILSRAQAAGKLTQALEILGEDFREHWTFRHPKVRGSLLTEQDVFYVERAYVRLGLPSPQQS